MIGVFQELSETLGAPMFIADDLVKDEFETDLLGTYQLKNIKTTVQCIRLLQQKGFDIDNDSIVKGLQTVAKLTGLKGRWHLLAEHPKVVCDTAHNQEGLSLVMSQLQKEKFKQLHFVLGVVNDKDLKNILSLLPKNAQYYFCKPNIPRGLSADVLKREAHAYQLEGEVFGSVGHAYRAAVQQAGTNDFIYIGGSTFVVAELDL